MTRRLFTGIANILETYCESSFNLNISDILRRGQRRWELHLLPPQHPPALRHHQHHGHRGQVRGRPQRRAEHWGPGEGGPGPAVVYCCVLWCIHHIKFLLFITAVCCYRKLDPERVAIIQPKCWTIYRSCDVNGYWIIWLNVYLITVQYNIYINSFFLTSWWGSPVKRWQDLLTMNNQLSFHEIMKCTFEIQRTKPMDPVVYCRLILIPLLLTTGLNLFLSRAKIIWILISRNQNIREIEKFQEVFASYDAPEGSKSNSISQVQWFAMRIRPKFLTVLRFCFGLTYLNYT